MVRGVPASTLLEDLATFAGAWALWTGAGWILLAGRVRPRLITTGAQLTALGFATLRQLSALYLPNLVTTNQQQFGLLGVAFTLFTWLTACSFVIVVVTVVGTVLADDPGRRAPTDRSPKREAHLRSEVGRARLRADSLSGGGCQQAAPAHRRGHPGHPRAGVLGQPTGKTVALVAVALLVVPALIEFLGQPPQRILVAPQPSREPGVPSVDPEERPLLRRSRISATAAVRYLVSRA
jgi:hypothetical protein